MQRQPVILKNRKLPSGLDFRLLRKEGLERIRRLASETWTDHNLHDPGITILEALCYAVTDLGARADLPIEDLLARPPGSTVTDFFTAARILNCNPVTILDFRKLIIDQEGIQNGWLHDVRTAEPPRPAFSYRCRENSRGYDVRIRPTDGFQEKLLNGLYDISLQLAEDERFGDLNGNVVEWEIADGGGTLTPVQVIFPHLEVEFPSWDHPLGFILNYGNLSAATVNNYQNVSGDISFDLELEFEGDATRVVPLTGLGLLIGEPGGLSQTEIESALEDVSSDSFSQFVTARLKRILSIMHRVYCALHRHRNLCEDYARFRIVRAQEIAVCADIQVSPETDLDELLARIYFEIDRFLAPPVHFYTLGEMIAKGLPTEAIFEGLVPEHGFIDSTELALSDLRSAVHVSDLYRIIMSLDGVLSVKGLMLTNYLDGRAQTSGERWCLQLGGPFHLNLDVDRSRVLFHKDELPFRADPALVQQHIRSLKAVDSRPKLALADRDLPIPLGTPLPLSEYYSVQNDLPLVYGVGQEGLPTTSTPLRRAQAKQLKAFLMFFDQLLADELAQLSEGKNLLSVDNSLGIQRTVAIQPLYRRPDEADREDFPHVANLFKDFLDSLPPGFDLDDFGSFQVQWDAFTSDPNNGYLTQLRELTEDQQQFEERRNRFLDHLLARFGEAFTEYALLMYDLSGKKSRAELIRDKEAFLSNYPAISRDRGKAFQLKCLREDQGPGWQPVNLSGLERRLGSLLGIDVIERRQLGYTEADIMADFTLTGAVPNLRFEFNLGGGPVLSSPADFATEAEARAAIEGLISAAAESANFVIRPADGFDFDLFDQDSNLLATHGGTFPSRNLAEDLVRQIVEHIAGKYFREGMHLLEHLLLRPVKDHAVSEADIDAGAFPECKLHEDCSCPIADHYSFRISIVLPFWPKRFRNFNFRRHVERTIHQETPAHILPKICWVSRNDMNTLEECYLHWLNEATKRQPDRDLLSNLINDLVRKLNTLTSVYPEGVLHDCLGAAGEDAVFLDRTNLGTFEET